MMSFYNTNLSLCFCRYIGKNNAGLSQYDTNNLVTTTINYEGASLLYQIAISILNGKNSENEIKAVLQCNNAALIFDYVSEGSQMVAYLSIDKNNQSITFRFSTHTYQVKNDGQLITKVVQSALGAFAKTVEGYLTGVGADRHLAKMPDDTDESQGDNQQKIYAAGNNNGYQQGDYNRYQQRNDNGYQNGSYSS